MNTGNRNPTKRLRLPALSQSAFSAPKIASLRLRKALRLSVVTTTLPVAEELPFIEAGKFDESLFDAPILERGSDVVFRERNITITRSEFSFKDEVYSLDSIDDGFVTRLQTDKWPLTAGVLYILLGLVAALSSSAVSAGLGAAIICAALGAALVYRDLSPSYVLVLEFNRVVARGSTYPQALFFETYDGAYINRVYEGLEKAILGD